MKLVVGIHFTCMAPNTFGALCRCFCFLCWDLDCYKMFVINRMARIFRSALPLLYAQKFYSFNADLYVYAFMYQNP